MLTFQLVANSWDSLKITETQRIVVLIHRVGEKKAEV